MWGLGQGIGWSGARWILTSSTIARAMEQRTYGLKLFSPDRHVFIQKILDMFGDDTSQMCNTIDYKPLLDQTRENVQLHSHLVFVSGGLIALDKCSFYHVEFDFDSDGNPRMLSLEENQHELLIKPSFQGDVYAIRQMDPRSEHKTLGYYIAPSGSNVITIEKLQGFISSWNTRTRSSNLSDSNVFSFI